MIHCPLCGQRIVKRPGCDRVFEGPTEMMQKYIDDYNEGHKTVVLLDNWSGPAGRYAVTDWITIQYPNRSWTKIELKYLGPETSDA